jgi:hypothetical protein
MDISIKITGHDEIRRALQEIGRKAPRALTLTLNKLADDGQKAVQDSLATRFTLRRPDFVRKTIFRQSPGDFATNSRPRAAFGVNPARDMLAKFEEDSIKAPMSGRSVAIPLPAVRPTPNTVVAKALRVSSLRDDPKVRKITTPNGTFLVKERKAGKVKGVRFGARTDLLYRLVPSVRLKARLRFHATAQRTIDESFVRTASAGIDAALAGFKGRKL